MNKDPQQIEVYSLLKPEFHHRNRYIEHFSELHSLNSYRINQEDKL